MRIKPIKKKSPGQQWQKSITIDRDVVKFISKKKIFSQQLSKQLRSTLHADVLLIPEESLIKVTKKPGSTCIKDWNSRCCSMVRRFCGRFRKESFELQESVQKHLPKLGGMLPKTTTAYWMEAHHTKLAVMTEQSEREEILAKVREFLQNTGHDGKE